ncbi:MAG: polyamine aminopropyltransferase [Kiloniellales bacterium]|nr:polyamine aminopropyltransferase [Kiloniellales bacterium]
MTTWSEEADLVRGAWRIQLRMDRVLYQEKSGHQEIVLFENPLYGRVLALDGVVQTTERDEFFYHEMLVHLPMLTHGAVRRALIIGGGDGGALEELLKHRALERVTMVEIDAEVVAFSKTHLSAICGEAFDDPRLTLEIADGVAWVKGCEAQFDLILIDSTDPATSGGVLYTPAFYASCAGILADGGLLVTQNAVPFADPEALAEPWSALNSAFPATACYRVAVPSFYGGDMVFSLASNRAEALSVSRDAIEPRFAELGIETRYYTPAIHEGAFALPPYIEALMR